MGVKKRIKTWWRGKYVQPSLTEIFDGETQKRFIRPWTAQVFVVVRQFWLNHWQFLIGTLVAILLGVGSWFYG